MKFEDLLKELNITKAPEGHHHSRPGWIQIDCPFCGRDSNKWHLGYSLEDKYLNCWQCGYHSLVKTLMEITGQSYSKCLLLIGDLESVKTIKKFITGKLQIPKGVGELKTAHIRYLKSRGFNIEQLKNLWLIQGIGISSKLSWRIFIPIIYKGKTVSWTTRSLVDSGTRYISAKPENETTPHKELLYGEDYAHRVIIIHEGPTDVWKFGPGAVCTFGLNYTTAQLKKMVQYQNRVVCFDNNSEAQKVAKKLTNELSVFPGKTYNIELDAEDIGSAHKKEIKKVRKWVLSLYR